MAHLFRVTARDHSAVVLLTELAAFYSSGTYISLQEIATRMHLSEGYLEEIAALLKKAKLIAGKQGPRGGYRLARSPQEIHLSDIFIALEGPLELVECLSASSPCPVAGACQSKKIWKTVQDSIEQTLQSTKLIDVMNEYEGSLS